MRYSTDHPNEREPEVNLVLKIENGEAVLYGECLGAFRILKLTADGYIEICQHNRLPGFQVNSAGQVIIRGDCTALTRRDPSRNP